MRIKRLRLVKTFSPVLECPREILSDQFRGVPKFEFKAYMFDFLWMMMKWNINSFKCVLNVFFVQCWI